jgi:superfamily II DNA/RNA helicase
MKFKEYEIKNEIKHALSDLGFIKPLEVQEKVFPLIMEEKDLIVQSQTGSGKTAAFAIPLIEKIDKSINAPQVIVLTPTRELAIQVKDEFDSIGKYYGLKSIAIYGKESMVEQKRELKSNPHVIVAAPGRLMDHLLKRNIKTDEIKCVVIDEADEMLIMGFDEQISTILRKINTNFQVLLFSATISDKVEYLAGKYQKDPVRIEIESENKTLDKIEQIYYAMEPLKRVDFLKKMLKRENPRKAIVFCNTRAEVESLYTIMNKWDKGICSIHGGMDQNIRIETLNDFKRGKYNILITTDVNARGIHVLDITHVINYYIPFEKENYVHRIGRTGRVGKNGIAISFVTPRELDRFREIEKFVGYEIPLKGGYIERKIKEPTKATNKKQRYKDKINKGAKATIEIKAGRLNSRLKSSDFLTTISSVAGVYREDVGKINILDKMTKIDILNGKEGLVIKALRTRRIKGKVYIAKRSK